MERSAGWPVAGADRRCVLLILGYYGFHALLRRTLGGSLDLDEAAMLLDAQALAWGYGPQPPLYAWLQWAAFALVPDELLALALLKNALLATTALAVYAFVRQVHPPAQAGLATLGLLLLPQIAWESQRTLTHSVLATAVAAMSYLVFWRWLRNGGTATAAFFGLLVGLGLLSKANFAVVPAALVLAAATMPGLRARLRPAPLLAMLAVAAATVAAPLVWMLRHSEIALGSLDKIDRPGGGGPAIAAAGLGAVLVAALLFVALAAVVLGLIRWRFAAPMRPVAALPPLESFMWRALGLGLVLVAVGVVLAGATEMKDRWMQPVLFASAPAGVLWVAARVDEAGRRALRAVCLGLALLVAVVLPVEVLYGERDKPSRRSAPFGQIAIELDRRFPEVRLLIADREWLAGNLRYRLPGRTAIRLDRANLGAAAPTLLVWDDAEPDEGEALAARLAAQSGREVRLGPVTRLAASYRLRPRFEFVLHAAPLLLGPPAR